MEHLSINGISLAYERYGRGKPLVLIHGYPLDHSIWNELLPFLTGHFDLILPDLRGFGESTTIDGLYSIADLADDLAGLLNQLDLEKVALAGHSMGGYVALAFARKYPNRVSGLALVSSQALADTPERKLGRYKSAEEVAEKGVGLVADAMTEKLSPNSAVQEFIHPLIEAQSQSGVIGALQAMAEREDSTSWLSSFDSPLVLVHGEEDVLIPIARAREINAAVSSAQLLELQGVGHLPMLEAVEKTAAALKTLG